MDDLTPVKKSEIVLTLIFAYIIAGCIQAIILSGTSILPDNLTVAESVAYVIFWPLFTIKALAIGGWAVLESGYHLLIGA